jgi:hypothetical protein
MSVVCRAEIDLDCYSRGTRIRRKLDYRRTGVQSRQVGIDLLLRIFNRSYAVRSGFQLNWRSPPNSMTTLTRGSIVGNSAK